MLPFAPKEWSITSRLRWLGPTLGALILLVWLAPVVAVLDSRFLGVEYVDHYGTQWFYWYAGEILEGAQRAAHTDLFFYPWGKDVYGHTGSNLVDAWLAQPLLALWGQVEGYNLFLLVLMVTNGLAAARLAARFTADPLARWVVALIFTFQPYLLNELVEGRPTQLLMAFVVLFFERFLALLEPRGGWGAAVAAGVLLALTGYTYWYYAIFAGIAAVVIGLWTAVRLGRGALGPLLRAAVAAAVALALVLPVALPMLGTTAAGALPGLLDVAAWSEITVPLTREGQLIGIHMWQPFVGTTGFWMTSLSGSEQFIPRLDPLPFALVLPLLVILLRPGGLPRGPILAACLAVTVLAFGPIVMFGNIAVDNPVFRWALELFPPMQRLWWPGRAFAIVGIFAPLGAIPLLEAFASERARGAAAVALLALLVGSLVRHDLLPATSWDATVPAGYQCLATGPKGAVIDLPYAFTQGHLYYQTAHGRPILGGMLEDNPVFTPTELTALRASNRFVQVLTEGPPASGFDPATIPAADREAIHTLGYEYVVLQLDAYREREALGGMAGVILDIRVRSVRRSFDLLLGPPVYQDKRTVIWAPWGAEPPCDRTTFAVDDETPGRTDVLSQARDSGASRTLSHLGQPEDFAKRLAQAIIDRGGPDREAAQAILAGTSPPAGK